MNELPLPLVVATGNADKAGEIVEILVERTGRPLAAWAMTVDEKTFAYLLEEPGGVGIAADKHGTLRTAPDVEETGATLEANARIKAAALCAATGLLAVADDTGLEVDVLDGAPGVHSARYAGEEASSADNVAKLLTSLADVGPDRRQARFSTVALARWPDGREIVARGAVEGTIVSTPKGASGFGYDPVFVPKEGNGRTFAEMARAEKHALSHRGRAFRALAALLHETR